MAKKKNNKTNKNKSSDKLKEAETAVDYSIETVDEVKQEATEETGDMKLVDVKSEHDQLIVTTSQPDGSQQPENSISTEPEKDSQTRKDKMLGNNRTSTTSIHAEPRKAEGPTTTDQPCAPVPKKRLTLQERLALAAKSGKSSKRGASGTDSKSKGVSPERVVIPIPAPDLTPPEPEKQNGTAPSEADAEPQDPLFPENIQELSYEELIKVILEVKTKFSVMDSKIKLLKEEKKSLQEKVKSLSSITTVSTFSSSVNDHLLKEKDAKIAQLLKEGEELSRTELKLNNTIKKLKTKDSENEYEICDLKGQVETLESERKALKESLKMTQENEQRSTMKTKALEKQLNHEQQSLKDEITRTTQLSLKVEELSQTLIQEKNKFMGEINSLKRSLEKEKQRLIVVREDHSREVARLEEKIEQLRFQAENAQTSSSSNDESYLKLVRQHDVLQKQYTSATENWQSIEAALMSKANNLESEVSALQGEISKSEQKAEILAKDLQAKVNEAEITNEKLGKLAEEHCRLRNQLITTAKTLEDAQTSLDMKEMAYNKERSALQYKIQGLERQIREQIQPQQLAVPDQAASFGSSIFSRNASTPSLRQARNWETREIGLGESSTTPVQTRKSSVMYPQGFFDEHDPLSDIEDDDVSSNYNSGSRKDSSSAIGGSNVQLLGKMSSQVRRLQTELATMREDMERLINEKKAANEEIVILMKDNEQVQRYKDRIHELEEQAEGYVARNEKTLEILGEKSEQVEELKADVQDLKDLLKLQVQQLVELQNR
jgi:outer membrane murein-binding lipoprotein Lpp